MAGGPFRVKRLAQSAAATAQTAYHIFARNSKSKQPGPTPPILSCRLCFSGISSNAPAFCFWV